MSKVVPLRQRLIFAMGGGGFTMEPSNPLLDDFALGLSHAAEPRVLFLPTASGDQGGQITAFRARFGDRVCAAEHLSLFRLREVRRPLAEILLEQDVIYVGGGSMRNLLALWRAHDIDAALVHAWETGVVLAGLSAGAMCWFQAGVTRSNGPPEPIAGLSLLPGSLTVHADGEPERLPIWLSGVRAGGIPGGWAVDDGVGLLFRGHELDRVVSSRPGASAQRIDAVAGELVRKHVKPELLGDPERGGLGSVDEAVAEFRSVRRMRRAMGGGLA